MSDYRSSHIEETVERLAEMQREQEEATTTVQRITNRATAVLANPSFVLTVFGLVMMWILGNSFARYLGSPAVDAFPFPDLVLVATVAAFLLALIILSTQRHEDERATKRTQLTLQIALLSEKKIAKVIALLEEQRRENPMLTSRIDHEAEAMAHASDPRSSLEQTDKRNRGG